ncbi:g9023 [Coccomyxa elongata]
MSAQKIEAELTALTESFANLVRSARINEDTDDTKRAQVPGEILEVLAEKLVYAAHQLLQSTAELKRRAFLAASGVRLSEDATNPDPSSAVSQKPQSLKEETEIILQELGTLSMGAVEGTHSSQNDDLASLHKLILELSGGRHREVD